MFDRVRRSLVIGNVLAIVAIVALLGVGLTVVMDRFLVAQGAADLRARSVVLIERLRDGRDEGGDQALLGPTGGGGAALVVWGPAGRVLVNGSGLPVEPLRGPAETAAQGGSTDTVVALPSGDALVVSIPLSGVGGVVQLVEDLGPIRAVEREVTLLLAGAGLVGLALAILAGWFLAARAMRPIERAFERQREFTADASHELRTPLAVVDAGLQAIARHPEGRVGDHAVTIRAMREQTTRMARLVGGLLTLARADAGGAEVVRAETDVDAIVRRTAVAFGPLAAERGATVEIGHATAGTARVDADRIDELLGILVDNALRHGGPGVRVRLDATRLGSSGLGTGGRDALRIGHGGIELLVTDDGPGIPAAERERATERFVRGDASRTGDGAGLGLSIARWIAEAHDGRLVLEDATPGLRVRVTLPA